jgi:ribonuclease BN (tRNA processing enzyme)
MRLTVLGGCGAWPAAGQACSGYLVEHDGFRLLIDPGYAILPQASRPRRKATAGLSRSPLLA